MLRQPLQLLRDSRVAAAFAATSMCRLIWATMRKGWVDGSQAINHRCEASVEAAVNHNVYTPQSARNSDDDDPLYRFTTRLTVAGISPLPRGTDGRHL